MSPLGALAVQERLTRGTDCPWLPAWATSAHLLELLGREAYVDGAGVLLQSRAATVPIAARRLGDDTNSAASIIAARERRSSH